MYHQVPVGIGYGGAHFLEEAQPVLYPKLPLVAPLVDGQAIHQLHPQPGNPIFRGSSVQDPGDVGVLQPGQDLPLPSEAGLHLRTLQSAPKDLDRHLLLKGLVRPLRQIHDPHTTFAQLPAEAVGADASTIHRKWRFLQKTSRAIGGLYQLLQLPPQSRVADRGQRRCPLLRGQLQQVGQPLPDLLPAQHLHADVGVERRISRLNHARAVAQERLTVAGEVCNRTAVSSMVRPEK